MRMINETDAAIAMILQENARTSNAEVARQVCLAPSAVFERIRKLEEKGVLRGFHADVDPHAPDGGLIDPADSPRTRAADLEEAVRLEWALGQLPEHYRQVILLRHRDGLAWDEVGRRMERSADSARHLWVRAVDRLQELLEPLHEPK